MICIIYLAHEYQQFRIVIFSVQSAIPETAEIRDKRRLHPHPPMPHHRISQTGLFLENAWLFFSFFLSSKTLYIVWRLHFAFGFSKTCVSNAMKFWVKNVLHMRDEYGVQRTNVIMSKFISWHFIFCPHTKNTLNTAINHVLL